MELSTPICDASSNGATATATITVSEWDYYDPCTTDQDLWIPNKADIVCEYDADNGMRFYSGTSTDSILTAKYTLPTDYEAQFTWMGGRSYTISMYWSDSFIQTLNGGTSSYEISIHYGVAGTRINRSISEGDVFKVVKQGTTITYYQNDVQVFTGTLTNPNNELRRYALGSLSTRYSWIKDIKVKRL